MFALNRFTCALALALLPALAFAQAAKPSTPYRVGLLFTAPRTAPGGNFDAFAGQLREYGYVEGQNIDFVWRSADGREDRLAPLAAELTQEKVDVIVAFGPSASRAAARQAPPTLPVVISTVDAVEQGLVASLNRPGGNVTGISLQSNDSAGKQLEKFKETIPGISLIGIVANPAMPGYANVMKSLEIGAAKLGLRLIPVGVADPAALVPAFDELKNARADALLVIPEPVVIDGLIARIVALAAERRLPAMY